MPALPRVTAPSLPRWPSDLAESWEELRRETEVVRRRAGAGTAFDDLAREVRELIDKDLFDTLDAQVRQSPRAARALTTVWAASAPHAKKALTPELLDAVAASQPDRASRLGAIALADTVLTHFDLLDRWHPGLFDAARSTLTDLVARVPVRASGGDAVEAVRHGGDVFLTADGPRRVARGILAEGVTDREWLARRGLGGHDRGRFGILVRHALYLERIATADHTTAPHEGVLTEVRDPDVRDAVGRDGLLFGHEVLMALADRPDDVPPGDPWLETIVEIGGDPRLTGTKQWAAWWGHLPPTTVARVVRWMSIEDLRLFLRAVENYGVSENKADILRMFPARKRFLEGLYESGLVHETRLILGAHARDRIVEQLGRLRTDSAILEERRDTSIIYIDCGSFHIVEGSHSFKLWVYAGRPVPMLADRSKRQFSPLELREKVPAAHARQHPGGAEAHVAVVHHGLWQAKALDFLVEELGVPVDLKKVLSEGAYYDLRFSDNGLPVIGRRRRAWA